MADISQFGNKNYKMIEMGKMVKTRNAMMEILFETCEVFRGIRGESSWSSACDEQERGGNLETGREVMNGIIAC